MNVFSNHLRKRVGVKRLRLRDERGAAVVEFALISVVFLMIVFGIIEFGILLFDKHILTNASREGARSGIVRRIPRVSDAAIQARVNQFAQANMVTFGPASTVTTIVTHDPPRPGTTELFGTQLTVNVTYDFDFLVLSGFGFGPITLTAETRMKKE